MYALATRRRWIQCSSGSAHKPVSRDHTSSSFADLIMMMLTRGNIVGIICMDESPAIQELIRASPPDCVTRIMGRTYMVDNLGPYACAWV
jgi:hypothetical protein